MLFWLPLLLASPALPADAECHALPPIPGNRLPFQAGEALDYDVDVLGGLKIGTVHMSLEAPVRQGDTLVLPVHAHGIATGLAASVGRLDSTATTWLRIHDLHPLHYREDYVESDGTFWTDVTFPARPHQIRFRFGQPNGTGERDFQTPNDSLDVLGAFYFLRALAPATGHPLCFDLYGARHVWRVWGSVAGRETVATPAGSFATVRLSGHAVRLDKRDQVREMHLWMTDDARHLPVAAMGELEIGPLRALLTGMGKGKRPETDR